MTKKEWNKLKLQITLGGKPDSDLVCEVGRCPDCKYYRQLTKRCRDLCQDIDIPTLTKSQLIIYQQWRTGFIPGKFDD